MKTRRGLATRFGGLIGLVFLGMAGTAMGVPSLIARIRAGLCAAGLAAVLAMAPLPAKASVLFQFVPDDPTIMDVAGFFEISDAAFAARMADTTVPGEVLAFSFEFFEGARFIASGSLSLADLGVGNSDISFKLTVDPTGEFLSAVAAIDAGGGGPFTNLFIFNSNGDFFTWAPGAGTVGSRPPGQSDVVTPGRFERVPEPGSLVLFGMGLAALALIRRRHRQS